MLELYTASIQVGEAAATLPPDAWVLAGGRAEDREQLALAAERVRQLPMVASPSIVPSDIVSRWPFWRTVLSGPRRSRQEEKWYRALVGVVAEAIDRHPDNLHWDLKYEAGKILRIVFSDDHGVIPVLKSSTQMDDDEFHAYVLIATEILFKKYLPEIRRRDVIRRVFELTGVSPPQR